MIAFNDSTKIKQTIVTSQSDRKYIENFERQVDMLCGMVKEMFTENKVMLLSPVLRELIANKGREVDEMRKQLHGRLCADNLGEDFK